MEFEVDALAMHASVALHGVILKAELVMSRLIESYLLSTPVG
jgi:hypothetical protein